jgi:hypothetical protein
LFCQMLDKYLFFLQFSFFSQSTCFKCEFIYVVFKHKCGISWTNVNAISCIVHLGWVFAICEMYYLNGKYK